MRGVNHIFNMTQPDEGAQSTAHIAEAQPTAFISNVPLPPRLELHGNLAQNWTKWRQVWTAYETVTNLAAQSSPIGPDALDIHIGLAFKMKLISKALIKYFIYGMPTA